MYVSKNSFYFDLCAAHWTEVLRFEPLFDTLCTKSMEAGKGRDFLSFFELAHANCTVFFERSTLVFLLVLLLRQLLYNIFIKRFFTFTQVGLSKLV